MSKKILPSGNSTSAPASPSTGGRLSTMAKQDKAQMDLTTLVQGMAQGIQDIKMSMGCMQEKMGAIEQKIENFQQMVERNDEKLKKMEEENIQRDEKIQKMEEKDIQKDEKIGSIDDRVMTLEQNKNEMVKWEMERSEFYLRFQNIEEEKGQDLAAVMIEICAEALKVTKEKMMDGVDETYRVFTRYASRNNLPREVHVRFTKKSIKTQILQAAREKALKYKDKEIVVLKQVPRKVREMRREYRFLTKILIEREVNYRWLFPEGLVVTWKDQRHRIGSIDEAEMFYNDFFKGRDIEREREITPIEIQEMGKEEGAIGGQVETKEQREIRSTRAVRPKYKA